MATKRIGYLPRSEKEAKKLAAALTLLDVNYKIGYTCGKAQPIVDVELEFAERVIIAYAFLGMPKLENYNYYVVREVAH